MICLKRMINRILLCFGMTIIRNKRLEPSVVVDEEIGTIFGIQYRDMRNGVVVTVPMEKGRALPIFSYRKLGSHPFVLSARAAVTKNIHREKVVLDVLSNYYAYVSPCNVNEVLGLSSSRPELNELPGWAVVMPWDEEDIFCWKEKIVSSVLSENSRYRKNTGVDYGWAWAGPTSEIKCGIEARRLLGVLDSIVKCGYRRHNGPDGDIVANVLARSSDEWVWQSVGAQHRAAVLAALGNEYVPIRVVKLIRREDVSSWPNVVRGLYTEREALKIFDDIFEENYCHVTSDWERFISENGYA